MIAMERAPGEEFLAKGHFAHISQWLPVLEDLTFETRFLDLSHDDSKALQKYTENSRMIASHSAPLVEGDRLPEVSGRLSPAQRASVKDLRSRIDEALASLASPAFVRLDTRSPKDGVLLLPECRRLLRLMLGEQSFRNPYSQACQTFDSACVHRAIIAAQRVSSGQEALDLLRHSQRVEADLVVGQISNGGDAASRLVLRRWCDDIDPLLELRVFVCEGQVSGISQYYSTCFVPELVAQRERIKQLVCAAVQQVHERMVKLLPKSEDLYTLDFALQRDAHGEIDRALLVEVNPAPPVAGTILFDWKNPKDRAILCRSSENCKDSASPTCELRLFERPVLWASIPFHPPLKEFADEFRGRSSFISAAMSFPALHPRAWWGGLALVTSVLVARASS